MAKESNSIQSISIEKIHALPGTEQEQQPDKAYGSLVSSILINGVKEPVILRPWKTETTSLSPATGASGRQSWQS